jgi:PQQ-like domain
MKLKRSSFGVAPELVDVEVTELPEASLPERFSPDPPPSEAGALQPFGGAAQNSRSGANLGAPTAYRWVQRFEMPLRPGAAHSVMWSGDRVLVQARLWQLFSLLDGRALRAGLGGPSPVAICSEEGTFRFVSSDGTLDAYRLSDGEGLWSCGAPAGDGGPHPVLANVGRATFLAGFERRVNPEAESFSPEFVAQWIDPTAAPDISPGGILRNARRSPALVGPAKGEFLGAADARGVTLTQDDLILSLSLDQQVTYARASRFSPRSVSRGGAGRSYLVVDTPDGAALWMINAQGERVFARPLPKSSRVPPIVAADHRVFVSTDDELLAFDPEGRPLWRVSSPLAPRAVVTADGWLLVSLGEELRAFDAEGRSAVLSYSVGRPFVTAPVITAHGEILVATTETLVCLSYEELTFAAGYRPA